MKKTNKILLIISLLLIPIMVYAVNFESDFPLSAALIMEVFVSIHMSLFVLKPLAEMISKDNPKRLFWIFFAIRAGILLFCDFFVTPGVALIDFFAVFVGAFILIPLGIVKSVKNQAKRAALTNTSNSMTVPGVELKCAHCNSPMQVTDKFCQNCGAPFEGNNVVVTENGAAPVPKKELILPSHFDMMYQLSEEQLIDMFINKELGKAGVDLKQNLIPTELLRRKKIFNTIFAILVFILVSLVFFHFPVFTYIIGLILLGIFFKVTRNYDLMKYLRKQVKARPSEKISNIVMYVKTSFVEDNSKKLFILTLLVALILPLIIFRNPVIIYEKTYGGYAVRYYAYGITNYKNATIPKTHKNENVVSLRGNTFSNMPYLESVILPDTIKEIRGQAFKNCVKLKEVNIPTKLEYLGGGAFYNAKSIKSIELPDTLTYMGGEAFYNASALEYIKLSNKLEEIRGDTFEYCSSLKAIAIPDTVTRIGGHAFYGDTSLAKVSISKNSQLREIGSSAFRQCYSLQSITIPENVYVNERAFKESPTKINHYKGDQICGYVNGYYECH